MTIECMHPSISQNSQSSSPHPSGFVSRIAIPNGFALAAAYAAARESLGPAGVLRCSAFLVRKLVSTEERLLWHGTSWECVPNIVRHGFNRAYAFNARRKAKNAVDARRWMQNDACQTNSCILLAGVDWNLKSSQDIASLISAREGCFEAEKARKAWLQIGTWRLLRRRSGGGVTCCAEATFQVTNLSR